NPGFFLQVEGIRFNNAVRGVFEAVKELLIQILIDMFGYVNAVVPFRLRVVLRATGNQEEKRNDVIDASHALFVKRSIETTKPNQLFQRHSFCLIAAQSTANIIA